MSVTAVSSNSAPVPTQDTPRPVERPSDAAKRTLAVPTEPGPVVNTSGQTTGTIVNTAA